MEEEMLHGESCPPLHDFVIVDENMYLKRAIQVFKPSEELHCILPMLLKQEAQSSAKEPENKKMKNSLFQRRLIKK